jgi:hypothetical protein
MKSDRERWMGYVACIVGMKMQEKFLVTKFVIHTEPKHRQEDSIAKIIKAIPLEEADGDILFLYRDQYLCPLKMTVDLLFARNVTSA